MRYFEIAWPSAWHILTHADPRDAAGEPRSGWLRDQWRLGCANSWNPSGRNCNFSGAQYLLNRQSRRRHLSPLRSR
jgi:hypothetical protein